MTWVVFAANQNPAMDNFFIVNKCIGYWNHFCLHGVFSQNAMQLNQIYLLTGTDSVQQDLKPYTTPTLHHPLLTEVAPSLVSYSGPVLALLHGSHAFAELQSASKQ